MRAVLSAPPAASARARGETRPHSTARTTMPLSESELADIRSEAFADDLPIDLATMSLWSPDEAAEYFGSGGLTAPAPAALAPAPAQEGPPVLVCFYSAGMTAAQGRGQLKRWLAAAARAGYASQLVLDHPTEWAGRPEPPDWHEYLAQCEREIDADPARAGRRLVIFGHSHGALAAYGLAARLGTRVTKLYVAARRPPTVELLGEVVTTPTSSKFRGVRLTMPLPYQPTSRCGASTARPRCAARPLATNSSSRQWWVRGRTSFSKASRSGRPQAGPVRSRRRSPL